MKSSDILPRRYCDYCGVELPIGVTYWYINGGSICEDCLPEYAKTELRPFRQVRGEEAPLI